LFEKQKKEKQTIIIIMMIIIKMIIIKMKSNCNDYFDYVAGVLASAAFVTERAHYHKGETSTFNQIKTY